MSNIKCKVVFLDSKDDKVYNSIIEGLQAIVDKQNTYWSPSGILDLSLKYTGFNEFSCAYHNKVLGILILLEDKNE